MPACVPPATRTLSPARTLASRNRAAGRGERAEVDEVVQPAGAERELADVDRGEAAGDALEDDVQPVALGQHRVDERLADVDAPAAGLEHPLHQLLHLRGRQDRGGQLVPPLPRDEDLARVVDPHLLDGRVVEVGLQRPEPGHPRDQLADHRLRVRHRRDLAGEAALVVRGDHPLRDPAYGGHLGLRIDPVAADGLAHPRVQVVEQRGVSVGIRESHPVPVPSEVLPHPDPGHPDVSRGVRRSCGELVTAVTSGAQRTMRDSRIERRGDRRPTAPGSGR